MNLIKLKINYSASSDGYLNGLRMAWEIINCSYEDEDEKRKLRTIYFFLNPKPKR